MGVETALSIIMPVYNSEQYLRESIASVLAQTFTDFELILVDDGSTDGSLQICREYKEKDPRIVLLEKEHRGASGARKAGVLAANAGYIGFLDNDDWIDKDMYANMYRIAAQYHPDLVSCGIIWEYESGQQEKYRTDTYEEGLYNDLDEQIYPYMLWDFRREDYGLYHNLVTKLFKKELLLEVYEQIDERIFFGEDALTLCSYCMKAHSIYIMKKAYYHYRIHTGSMCHQKNLSLMDNMWRLHEGLRKTFISTKCEQSLMRQLRRYILDVNTHLMRQLFDVNTEVYREWHFSSDELLEHRIVLYGAGVCGQAYYQYILKKGKEHNVIAWLDRAGGEKSHECLYHIEEPEKILKLEYDYVVITVSDPALRDHIQQDLCNLYGVDSSNIRWAGGHKEEENK